MSEQQSQTRAALIEAVGLSKTFLDFWRRPKARAVSDLDFAVRPGEVVGLLGPNGSGKSTTIKMILGLLYPTTGTIQVFGQSPRKVENKRLIGYLPEESHLYRYLTAAETLDFFGALFGLPAEERRRRTGQLLEMVGLEHARHRPVGEFSKGMARRIGLAQAMINDPELLILDEPTAGLDPLGCKEVKDIIRLLRGRGKTVLISSHLLADVEDVCDRAIILYGGRIRAQGPLRELLAVHSASRIVTPQLPATVMNRVLSVLREHLAGEEIHVDHPQRSLEEFFLEVVAAARAESAETAGVVGGGAIAAYLREGPESGESPLERLVQPTALPETAPDLVPETAEPSPEKKLSELVVSPTAPPPSATPPETIDPEANRRLSHLVRDRSGNAAGSPPEAAP